MSNHSTAINGGRVQFVNPATNYKNVAVRNVRDPLYTVQKTFTPTPLICAYFSKSNLHSLQDSLAKRIFDLSKGQYRIGTQSETDLVVVMRSVFCMYGRNLCSCRVEDQVRQLNGEVLAMIVPTVYSRILSYMGYRRDVASNVDADARQPMEFLDRGVSTSGPKRKVLTYPLF